MSAPPLAILARSGLRVSRLGLGLAALGRPGYITLGHGQDLGHDYAPDAMQTATAAVLDRAYAAGIRYVDAARSYGRAEAFLADWLWRRGHPPGSITVGSKWGYAYTAGWRVEAERHEVKEHSHAQFVRQLAESRALLGAHLQLYQIHSATLDSGVLDDAAVLEALAATRTEGLAVGLTLSGPRQAETLRRALAVRVGGRALFDVVQATWNLFERSVGEALHAAHDAGVGVIIKEALANGRLTARGAGDRTVAGPDRLARAAGARGCTPEAQAIAAVLARPWVDVVLSGAATVDQLQSNLAALDVEWDAPLETELRSLAEAPERYWATRAALPWN